MVSNRMLLPACSIAIFVYGMIAALAGTIVPQLSRSLSLSPRQIGDLFLAQALGMMAASVAAGPLVDNRGKKTGMILALALIAGSLFTLPASAGFAAILISIAVLGLGNGILVTTTNAVLSDINPQRRASILTVTKCFYGAGGFLTPFVGATLLAGNTIALCYVIAGLTLATCLLMALTAMPPPSGERRFKLSEAGSLLGSPLLYLLSLMLFVYVACEVGMFNWLAKHLIAQGMAETAALSALSLGFATGLLAGRLFFAAVLMKVAAPKVTLWAAVSMVFTTSAVLQFTSQPAARVVAFLAGMAMAPIFPGVLAMVGDSFPRMTATALGIVITSGWAGLAVSSRLIGIIAGSDPKGIKTGLLVLPVFSAVLVLLTVAVRSRLGKSSQAETDAGTNDLQRAVRAD
jgi:fucose permease